MQGGGGRGGGGERGEVGEREDVGGKRNEVFSFIVCSDLPVGGSV